MTLLGLPRIQEQHHDLDESQTLLFQLYHFTCISELDLCPKKANYRLKSSSFYFCVLFVHSSLLSDKQLPRLW